MAEGYKVYWQPGCTSCLRAKEFLKEHGIPFESINVRKDAGTIEELARLGAMSIPVITRGDDFAFAQELHDRADFVGVALDRKQLPPTEFNKKINFILTATQRYVQQIPADKLRVNLPGRNRNCLDLAFHIFVIPTAFLDAARGGSVTFEHFEHMPPEGMDTVEKVVAYGDEVRADFAAWWGEGNIPATLATYYGEQPAQGVMERTAWHAAQHCRQLMQVLADAGIAPNGPLGDAEFVGLPLPGEVYDDEVPLTWAARG